MTSFDDFIDELRRKAEADGPEAVAAFREFAGILAGLRAVARGETHELELPPGFGPED